MQECVIEHKKYTKNLLNKYSSDFRDIFSNFVFNIGYGPDYARLWIKTTTADFWLHILRKNIFSKKSFMSYFIN